MTDDSEDSTMRLNAALDGELDAMSALEFERQLAADPALAAEYRRLDALRQAVRRFVPLEAAPSTLAARIAGLAEPAARSAVSRGRRPAWPAARPFALAASMAAFGFAGGAGLMSLGTQS